MWVLVIVTVYMVGNTSVTNRGRRRCIGSVIVLLIRVLLLLLAGIVRIVILAISHWFNKDWGARKEGISVRRTTRDGNDQGRQTKI